MRFTRVMLATAASFWAVTAHASANEVYVYRGSALASEGIVVGSWGSGRAVESKERTLVGSNSIKITTQGLYAGGRIDFSQPVTLFTGQPEKGRYVVFSFWFDDSKKVDPSAGTNQVVDLDPYAIPKTERIRFIFVNDKGVMTSIVQPTVPLDPDDNWVRIAVPLTKLKLGEGESSYRMSRLMVFTDTPTTLHLGEVKLQTDVTPITGGISGDLAFGVNQKSFYQAEVRGGLATLKYSWDYNAADGIQTESTGMVGSKIYTTDGDYTITLTVSDVDGIKAPLVLTHKVSVNG